MTQKCFCACAALQMDPNSYTCQICLIHLIGLKFLHYGKNRLSHFFGVSLFQSKLKLKHAVGISFLFCSGCQKENAKFHMSQGERSLSFDAETVTEQTIQVIFWRARPGRIQNYFGTALVCRKKLQTKSCTKWPTKKWWVKHPKVMYKFHCTIL